MKYLNIPELKTQPSNIILGCMRINSLSETEINTLIQTALELGINHFDHADIYGGGECETKFAQAVEMNPQLREKMIIQSKCGIRKGFFDFSKEHIISAADQILSRLQTDYLDVLLLHRPDTLMEPAEVAAAFEELYTKGKVRSFGVSNQNPMQVELLQKDIPYKLWCNQLQFGIAHTPMVNSGITVNMQNDQGINREGSILEYSRLKEMTIQAWSPFQKGFFNGVFLGDQEEYAKLNQVIARIASKYQVSDTTVAVGWITRHPANMQVVLGTTNITRLTDSAKGSELPLTRAEWYEIYQAAGNILP